jgi:hypothetical protein
MSLLYKMIAKKKIHESTRARGKNPDTMGTDGTRVSGAIG